MTEPGHLALRLDRWLWFARLVRTRSGAARLCLAGRIVLAGDLAKPHHPVRVGDWVTLTLGGRQRRLLIRALGHRRGPAPEARQLYDEPSPPLLLDAAAAPWVPLLDEEERA